MRRRRRISEFNKALLGRIMAVKAEHPSWGFRRVWAWLRRREELPVNRKRVWRLMRENGLLVAPRGKLRAVRKNTTEKMRSVEPNTLWGTDMTKVMTGDGWAYVHVVIDWASKKLLACVTSRASKTRDWLKALSDAVNSQFPNGVRETMRRSVFLVSDHGSQPTSKTYMREAKKLGLNQVFTSYCNPKGNADTERVIRTIKEDLVWPREWASPGELDDALRLWRKSYNEEFPHSSLGLQTPDEYEKWFLASAS